jgi:hypothetical protein
MLRLSRSCAKNWNRASSYSALRNCIGGCVRNIVNHHAFEVPNQPGSGLHFTDLFTVSLGGIRTIIHVINETGATANSANQVVDLVSYP